MKQSGFEIIKLEMLVLSHICAHNGDLVHKILFEIGFICILLVLILIPAVQKLITHSAMLVFPAGPLPALGEIQKCFDAWYCWEVGHLPPARPFVVQHWKVTA